MTLRDWLLTATILVLITVPLLVFGAIAILETCRSFCR